MKFVVSQQTCAVLRLLGRLNHTGDIISEVDFVGSIFVVASCFFF